MPTFGLSAFTLTGWLNLRQDQIGLIPPDEGDDLEPGLHRRLQPAVAVAEDVVLDVHQLGEKAFHAAGPVPADDIRPDLVADAVGPYDRMVTADFGRLPDESPGLAPRRSTIRNVSSSSRANAERTGSSDRKHCSWESTPGFVFHTRASRSS